MGRTEGRKEGSQVNGTHVGGCVGSEVNTQTQKELNLGTEMRSLCIVVVLPLHIFISLTRKGVRAGCVGV